MGKLRDLLEQLRRRGVIRTSTLYVGAVWLLISIGDVALPLLGAPPWLFPTLIWAGMIGLPFTALLSWFFSIRAGGIQLDSGGASPTADAADQTGRPLWDVVIIGLLLGGLSVSLYFNWFGAAGGSTDRTSPETSLAVLPFRDLSPGGDNGYLSDGIAEELLDRLTRSSGLRVVSRRSAFSFRDERATTSEIAERLNVAHIVEGSVRTIGNLVRVTVQLIDTRADAARWSLTYERPIGDVFSLQDQIATDVSDELEIALDNRPHRPRPVNAEAHDLLLRARHLARQFTQEGLQRSNELLQQALEIDPNYIDAWNALSGNYATQAGDGFLPADTGIRLSRQAAQRSLAIDAHNADALAGLGWIAMRFDNDLVAAASYLERALALHPGNAEVVSSAGNLLFRLGRLRDAIRVAEHITEIDPLDSFAWANLGVYRLYALDTAGAIDAYRSALELSPGFVGGHYAIGVAHLLQGEHAAALEAMAREADDEFRTKGRALAFHGLGDRGAFQRELSLLQDTWGARWPSEVAEVYAYAGDLDQAFAWITRDIDAGSGGAGWAEAVLNPLYRSLHGDRRWPALLDRLALAPADLEAVRFAYRGPP